MVDIKKESQEIRDSAEKVFREGGSYHPMLVLHRDDHYQGHITVRETKDEDDERVAFTEACTLVSFLRADMVILAFDGYHHNEPDAEAFYVVFVHSSHAGGVIMPYERDTHGNFIDWTSDKPDEFNVHKALVGSHMVPNIVRFMKHGTKLRYARAMVETLTKRGHDIHLIAQDDEDEDLFSF